MSIQFVKNFFWSLSFPLYLIRNKKRLLNFLFLFADFLQLQIIFCAALNGVKHNNNNLKK